MANFCKTCGAPVAPSDVYCVRCGAPLTDGDANSNPFATPSYSGANDYADWGDPTAPDVPTNPISAFRICFFEKYVDFRGRASRSEYWYWQLATFLVALTAIVAPVPFALAFGLDSEEAGKLGNVVGRIVSYVFFLPNLAVAARRLHDRGQSGWLLLFLFVPFANIVAAIAIFVILLSPSKPETNKYGPAPRRRVD